MEEELHALEAEISDLDTEATIAERDRATMRELTPLLKVAGEVGRLARTALEFFGPAAP